MLVNDRIRDLFLDGPPPRPRDVRKILSGIDKVVAGDALIALIEKDLLTRLHFGLFVEVASQIDLSSRFSQRLVALANDTRLSQISRQLAVVALTTGRGLDVDTFDLIEQLDPELVQAASDMPIAEILTAIQLDPAATEDLKDILLGAPPEAREFMLLHHVGRVQREIGTPAAFAYAAALADPVLAPLHDLMLDAIVREGDEESIPLLETLRDTASDDALRRRFQMAILRMGTRNIEGSPKRHAVEGQAYVSGCDGQSTFFLICRLKVSEASTTTVSCCIRASGEIRDAFALPNQADDEIEQMLDDLNATQGIDIAELPLGQAATLFLKALERTRAMNSRLPDSARTVVSLLTRVENVPLDDIADAKPLSIAKLKKVLDRQCYDSWFLDRGDLLGYGVPLPQMRHSEQWLRAAAMKLAGTSVKERILAMLGYMTQWHYWNKEPDTASLLAAARTDLVADFAGCAIVRLLLERSTSSEAGKWNDFLSNTLPYEDTFGNESLRHFIRMRFYPNLKRPSGRHMAELDFTEVAYFYLQMGFNDLPGERRPREESVLLMSHTVGRVLVEAVANHREIATIASRLMTQVPEQIDLSPSEVDAILETVVSGLMKFIDRICGDCLLNCLKHQRRGMTDAFFSPTHPGLD